MKRKYFYLLLPLLFVIVLFGKDWYMQPAYDDGERAPNVSATLANGETFELTDLQGKYVLLDFWGSWCGPCIYEMPGLFGLHDKFADAKFQDADGLAIVSVAVEKREERWQRALQKYRMPWKYQILDQAESLSFFDSPIASDYGVKQVPTKFLISPNGTILAVDQTPEEIAEFLSSKLK